MANAAIAVISGTLNFLFFMVSLFLSPVISPAFSPTLSPVISPAFSPTLSPVFPRPDPRA
ncbi:hypothetical protein D4758_22635 [Enterocloster citroniae]|nr:hypothetical protein [Enterocloster citroniae]